MNKLIPKHLNGYVLLPDNTRVNPIIVQPRIPNFTKLNLNKLGRAILDKTKKENPDFYNKKVRLEAHKAKPNSEIVRYEDAEGKTKTSSKVLGMSGADPIASLYVEGVALNPVFKGLGKVALYGLAKAGNNWARAKILSKELDKSNPILTRTADTYIQTLVPKSPNKQEALNLRTVSSILDASLRLLNFYKSPEYMTNLLRASETDRIFSNMYAPNTLIENLRKGVEITPDKNRGWYGVTNFNRGTGKPVISIQENLPDNELSATSLHELAHASLKGGDATRLWLYHIKPYLSQNIELRNMKELMDNLLISNSDFKTMQRVMDNEHYATDINEIRSRMLSLMDLARTSKVDFGDFIDKYSYSKYPELGFGKLDAPGELLDLLKIMTPNSIKNFSKIVLGSVPILGITKKGDDK